MLEAITHILNAYFRVLPACEREEREMSARKRLVEILAELKTLEAVDG